VGQRLGNNGQYVNGNITNDLSNDIDPPTDEGCTWQLDVVVHLSCPDEAQMDECHGEFYAAIYHGGVAEATCSSNMGAHID
jgi:hypothetical protein